MYTSTSEFGIKHLFLQNNHRIIYSFVSLALNHLILYHHNLDCDHCICKQDLLVVCKEN
jgi:hypothetical protein